MLDVHLASVGVILGAVFVFAPLIRRCGQIKATLKFPNAAMLVVPWDLLTVLSMGVATSGLWLCLFFSLWHNGREVTHTHCRVPNVLGSISTCIGDFNPQRSFWKITVMLYLPQRVLATWPLAAVYEEWSKGQRWKTNVARAVAHLVEQLALGLLTAISSSEHLLLHEVAFGTFALAGMVNMGLTCSLLEGGRGARGGGGGEGVGGSLKWRRACALMALASLVLAICFFYVHNAYCISYGYSLFALFEWLFVLANSESVVRALRLSLICSLQYARCFCRKFLFTLGTCRI